MAHQVDIRNHKTSGQVNTHREMTTFPKIELASNRKCLVNYIRVYLSPLLCTKSVHMDNGYAKIFGQYYRIRRLEQHNALQLAPWCSKMLLAEAINTQVRTKL